MLPAAVGPRPGTRPPNPRGNTGGPLIPGPNIDPVRDPLGQQPAGIRPPGMGTTGGPKPAPTGIGMAVQNNPRIAANMGASAAALGKRLGMKKGGKVSSASKRADGCAVKGKTKGKIV